MSLRKLGGFALCVIALLVMGCDSGSDPADAVSENGGTSTDRETCRVQATAGREPETDGPDIDTGSGLDDGDAVTTTPDEVGAPMPLEGRVSIAGMDEDLGDLETDAYEIAIAGDAAPAVMGGILTVTLSRGGGCESHDFTLVAAPGFREGQPVELPFAVVHDGKDDRCLAYLTDQVAFDLTTIRDLYRTAYPAGDGLVFLAFQTPDGSACAYSGLAYDTAAGPSPSTESIDVDIPGGAAAAVVSPSEGWEPPMPTEADILANRLLQREDDSLLLDTAERSRLAGEIASVLSGIRDAYPVVGDVTARETYVFGVLLLGLEPELYETVASLVDGQTGPVTLDTGYAAFDSLNARLGLSVVDLFSISRGATFYFNEYLNVPAAVAAYEMVEGIEYAESNAYVGDGSDIDAVNSQGRWYVVARRASGDCPAGCIYQELFFFIVDGTDVEMIESEQALDMAEFEELVMNRGWSREEL